MALISQIRGGYFAALATALVVLLPAGAEAKKPRCFKKPATIVGTRTFDAISGTARRDVIVGRGGGDDIRGKGGNDLICAGRGQADLFGGPGRDRISHLGAPQAEVGSKGAAETALSFPDLRAADPESYVAPADAESYVDGGPGDDLLIGGKALEWFIGGGGSDTMESGGSSGGSSDTFFGDPGDDHYRGGPDFDTLDFRTLSSAGLPVTVDLAAGTASGQGSDRISGTFETLIGTFGPDVLRGSGINEVIYGHAGDDELHGLGGDDELHGFDGSDSGDGGAGVDLCDVEAPIGCEL